MYRQHRYLCRAVFTGQLLSIHSMFSVLSSPHSWDCCLLKYSERGTVICPSEQVTACICVKSFDDAEQKGLQVSQTAWQWWSDGNVTLFPPQSWNTSMKSFYSIYKYIQYIVCILQTTSRHADVILQLIDSSKRLSLINMHNCVSVFQVSPAHSPISLKHVCSLHVLLKS